MPYCEDCGKWEPPPRPFETEVHDWLRVAYHATNCPARNADIGGLLDGYIFQGDILYEVQPNGQWLAVSSFQEFPHPISEFGKSGEMPKLPSDFTNTRGGGDFKSDFKSEESTQPMAEVPTKRIAVEAYSWEEWKKKYPAYANTAERKVTEGTNARSSRFDGEPTGRMPDKAWNSNTNSPNGPSRYSSTTYNYKPDPKYYDEIDKKKWPNTWKWSFKFFFSNDFHKHTRFKYDGKTIYANHPYAVD